MSSILEFFVGKRLTPEEQVKKWRQNIRSQERELDKQIRGIDSQEMQVKRSMKQAAKKNDITTCRILAKEVARSRKVKDRLYTSKAQLNSMVLQLQQMLATTKVTGSLQKSTEVMKLVNNVVKIPEISATMQEMSQEMMKAGIIDEMIQETIEMGDEDGLEEEAEGEVEKVLFELTDGLLGQAGAVGAPFEKQKGKAKEEDMEARLQALKAI